MFTLYNTRTRKKETVVPSQSEHISFYSCGPTVYSTQHLGNMRAMFIVDLMRKSIEYSTSIKVKHVINITDVGHLTGENEGDANQGEDKMEKGARKDGISVWEVAQKYIDVFLSDIETLGISASLDLTADWKKTILMPRATDHIQEQIDMIKEMEKNGHTYELSGDGVYMDTTTFERYGELLSDKHLDGIREGSRVDLKGKRNPTDFALRKFNMTGKKRGMERDSPWGVGFPGWHIECSAMSITHLGEHIDIHSGGMEHIPVHHTNEIAQSECSHSSHPWVGIRVHYQRLMMNGKKISKSDGNVAYVHEAIEKGYDGEDIRYFFLQAHYRSFQDFSRENLTSASKARKKIIDKLFGSADGEYRGIGETCAAFLSDDMNTVGVLSAIHKMLGGNFSEKDREEILHLDDLVLGLGLREGILKKRQLVEQQIPDKITELAKERLIAKQNKEYALADSIRSKILDSGRDIIDGKDGWKITKL